MCYTLGMWKAWGKEMIQSGGSKMYEGPNRRRVTKIRAWNIGIYCSSSAWFDYVRRQDTGCIRSHVSI